MTDALSLANLRTELGRTWLITLFGIAYAISQITIIVILGPIEDAMIKPIFSSMTFTGSGTRCFLLPRCAGFSTDSRYRVTTTGFSYFHWHPDYSIGMRTTYSMYS